MLMEEEDVFPAPRQHVLSERIRNGSLFEKNKQTAVLLAGRYHSSGILFVSFSIVKATSFLIVTP